MSENHDKKIDENILSGRLFGAIPALLDNMPAGFAIMQVLVDEDANPYDFIYKYANSVYAYLEDVSLDDLMERTWGRLFPDAGEKLLGAFANIALNGGSRVIEELDSSRKKKTQIICYQPVYGYCACVVQELDIPDAADIPVEELSEPKGPGTETSPVSAENVQPELQQTLPEQPEALTAEAPQAEIPPLAALREEAQSAMASVSEPPAGAEPLPMEIPPMEIPPVAALQEQPEVKPLEVEVPQAQQMEQPQLEVKPIEVEAPQAPQMEQPQAEVKPIEVEVPQAPQMERPQPEVKPLDAEVPQAPQMEQPQAEVKPIEVEVPQAPQMEQPRAEVKPVEETAGELDMFADADMEETAEEDAVEMFEPISPAETADAFTAVEIPGEPDMVQRDIEEGLASLERLGDVPVQADGGQKTEEHAEPQEQSADGASVSIMDILENSKNQGAVPAEADGQGDTYGAEGQNVSIADIAAAAAGQPEGVSVAQPAPQMEMQQIEVEVPQAPQMEQSQPEQPQAETSQQAEQPAPQPESAGEPGNINLEVPAEKSFGGHIAEVIADLNHLDDFSAIMKLEDLMQSVSGPEQADSVTKAKQMIECSMFEEAKDLLRTLL